MSADTFSVIIPSFNEGTNIGRCIESVKANKDSAFGFEIIVVDYGSTDMTRQVAENSGVMVIENSGGRFKTISALRNAGAEASKGGILAFLDADMIVAVDWLLRAKEYFGKGFKGALGFVDSVPDSAGWVGRVWSCLQNVGANQMKDVDLITGRNFLVNREVFFEIGGFDETLATNEDKDITFRVLKAGYRAALVAGPTVVHMGYERGLIEFMKKEYWRQGTTVLFARHWGYSLRTLRNPAMSLWHLSLFIAFVYSLVYLPFQVVLLSGCLWVLPSLATAISKAGSGRLFRLAPRLFLLTFLRWHVAGVSLIAQILRGSPFKMAP